MITIDGTEYQEKQNMDENMPPCSMCHIPISKCHEQCRQYGNNYFFVIKGKTQEEPNNFDGCLKAIIIIAAMICGIFIAKAFSEALMH